ncbi:MAG: hypothetical protein ABII90_04055 [Bacteroidota bacterium]
MIFHKSSAIFLTILITLLICTTGELLGFSDKEKGFNKIFNLIYNQQFREAHAELIQSKNNIERWNYQMLLLDLYWWKAISSNRDDDFAALESVLKEYSTELKTTPNPDDLEELICLSYSLRLALIKNRLFSIVGNIYKINHIIEQFEIHELTIEQQDIFNIYLALFNIGKSKLFFYNPKLREEGIKVLESNLTSLNPVYQTISIYFLSKIYFELDKSPMKAMIYCEQLCKLYPDNKVFAHNLELCKK